MLSTTGSNQQELEGGLQGILQNIIQEQVDEMVNEMTAKVNEELKDLLDGAMETVKDTLGGLGEKVFGGTDENKGAQALLEPLFEVAEGAPGAGRGVHRRHQGRGQHRRHRRLGLGSANQSDWQEKKGNGGFKWLTSRLQEPIFSRRSRS